jgi:metal-sulfur cluster biosynthetic enzyme
MKSTVGREGGRRTPTPASSDDRERMRQRVLAALDTVIDPELDEPVTSLRFVSALEVTADRDDDAGGIDVAVTLRLPTPQCAPNFAFLMAADARDALRAVPDVRRVTIRLDDHYTEDEINAAIARGEGFTGAFPGETDDDDLRALRELFTRKALIARQSRICRRLMAGGASAEQIVALRVSDLPAGDETARCLQLRDQLGLPADPDAPGFMLPGGQTLTVAQLPRWLAMARLVATSLEANGGICRALLEARHGEPDPTHDVTHARAGPRSATTDHPQEVRT